MTVYFYSLDLTVQATFRLIDTTMRLTHVAYIGLELVNSKFCRKPNSGSNFWDAQKKKKYITAVSIEKNLNETVTSEYGVFQINSKTSNIIEKGIDLMEYPSHFYFLAKR